MNMKDKKRTMAFLKKKRERIALPISEGKNM